MKSNLKENMDLRSLRQMMISPKLYLIVPLALCSTWVQAQSGPYNVIWVDPIDVSVSSNTLTKSIPSTAWKAGCVSSNVLQENINGWIEFSAASGAHYIVGLAANNVVDNIQFTKRDLCELPG